MATKTSTSLIAGIAIAAAVGVGAYVYHGTGQAAAPDSQFVLLNGGTKSTADLKG